jgi:FlaG/FlaF family flagellin (archaellin)
MRELFIDDDAVTSVVGIVLMVAVAVLVASVISVFVLDIAESSTQDAPQADFGGEQINDTSVDGNDEVAEYKTLTVTHTGGDTLPESQVSVTVDGDTAYGYRQGSNKLFIEQVWQGDSEVDAGSSVTIIAATNAMDDEDFSTGGPYEYDIYLNGRGLVPQETSGAGEFADNTQLRTGETVRVAWESATGDRGFVLFEYDIK